MRISSRSAVKTAKTTNKLMGFGKAWKPGDKGIALYPVFWDEEDQQWNVLVAQLWGHNVDMQAIPSLKASFIPTTCKLDDNNDVVGTPDITYQFSRIAKSFLEGQKAKDLEDVASKSFPSEQMKTKALQDIEFKYDTKNNMKAQKVCVSKLKFNMYTEVIWIPYKGESLDMENARMYTQKLSIERLEKINSYLDDKKYAPSEGDKYIQIEYTFPMDVDKGKSGRKVSMNGLSVEYRVATKYPDKIAEINRLSSGFSEDSESMQKRNFDFRHIMPSQVKQALTMFAVMNADYLKYNDETGVEILCKNAELLKELTVIDCLSKSKDDDTLSLVAKLDNALAAGESEKVIIDNDQKPEFKAAPKVTDIIKNNQDDMDNTDELTGGIELV